LISKESAFILPTLKQLRKRGLRVFKHTCQGESVINSEINWLRSVLQNALLAITLSFLVISSVLLFKPLSFILGSPADFIATPKDLANYYLSGMMPYLSVSFVVLFAMLSIDKLKSSIVALLISFSVLFFVQSILLNWDYGALDGQSISWNSFWYRELIDLIVWSGVLTFFFIKKKSVLEHANLYALILILVQAIPVVLELLKDIRPQDSNQSEVTATYSFDYSKEFVFSKDKNVIVLVLDSVSDSNFADVINESPELLKEFDGFTRFDNVLGTGGYTVFSVVSYLTGEPYLNDVSFENYLDRAFNGEGSLLKRFKDAGWNTGFYRSGLYKAVSSPELLTEITLDGEAIRFTDPDLKSLSFYTGMPQSLKRWFYDIFQLSTFWEGKSHEASAEPITGRLNSSLEPFPNNSKDLEFVNTMLSSALVAYEQPSFKYYHLKGAHAPWLLDREFNKKNSDYEDAIYVSSKTAIRFIHILKELGVYDSSQIYIMTDHGRYPQSSVVKDVEQFITSRYPKQAAPMFMFKDYAASGELRVSNIPLSYFDFPSMVTGLSGKSLSTPVENFLQKFAKSERNFYSFFNRPSEYFPTIIEMKVAGVVSDPGVWSLTDRLFIRPGIKPIREFDCNGDILKLTKQIEFSHYVSGVIRENSGFTWGNNIDFSLPLKNHCDRDVVVRFKLAAVLGVDTRTNEEVNERTFHLSLEDNSVTSDIQQVDSENFAHFSFVINKEYIKDGKINFTLNLDNVIWGSQFVNRQGKKTTGVSLRLRSITLFNPAKRKTYLTLNSNRKTN